MTSVDIRKQNYWAAEALASTWESRRAQIEEVSTPVREWMVRELAARPGDTVLELAAGVGDTGFEVARIVGPEGSLISTDFSPAMVDAARRRGGELGLENVEYRVTDAERIDLEPDSVDGVLCRYGYMLMADPAAALADTRRVLRRGGRLVLAVWGPPQRNPFFALVAGILVKNGHVEPPDPNAPGIFYMAGEERTTALLEQAGFAEVSTDEVPGRFAFGDAGEYLRFITDTAGPIAIALRGLTDDERARIESQLEEACAPFAVDGGYELPGVTLVAVAS
jgi:ubiquinone/menaquinone biosynthesis C-methylase UbiE